MARAHVVKVETSIKAGAVAQLGPRTLIVGRNRIGKSTIVNAIEAAGSGRVSDVAGRASLAKDADLIMLAPNGGSKVFAEVRLSDGSGAGWTLERGHRAKRLGVDIAFPLRDVREAILGEPDKARKWILRHGSAMEWKDVLDLVPTSLHRRLDSIVEGEGVPPDASEPGAAGALAFAIDGAKARVREANAQAKAARGVSQSNATGTPPTEAEIAAAQAAVTAAAAAPARAALLDVRVKLAEARQEIATFEERERALRVALAALPQIPTITEIARNAISVAEALATAGVKACAICGGATDPKALALRAANARRKLDEAMKIADEKGRIESALRSVESSLSIARPLLGRLEEEEKRHAATAGAPPADDAPLDLATAQARLADLTRRRASWEAVRRGEERALEAEREAGEWGQLADALSRALGILVDRARLAFESRVQRFLPESMIFGVDLLDGEREVLRVGLRKLTAGNTGIAPTLNAALSGAEWATVTAALALATAPETGPVVIAPEERAFDAETLTEVLAAFGVAGDAQIVITSPVAPARIPEGWTVIDLDALRGGAAPRTFAPDKPKRRKKGDPEPLVKPEERPAALTSDDIFGPG